MGMRRKSERENKVAIASYRPIRKAEAADCISPVKGRAEDDDDDNHDLEQKTVFFPSMINDKRALGDAQQKS